jgi:hypothetical protein
MEQLMVTHSMSMLLALPTNIRLALKSHQGQTL